MPGVFRQSLELVSLVDIIGSEAARALVPRAHAGVAAAPDHRGVTQDLTFPAKDKNRVFRWCASAARRAENAEEILVVFQLLGPL